MSEALSVLRSKDTKLKLHAGQRLVFNDKHRVKVVVAGRRWGKTQLAKSLICKAMCHPKWRIWYVAPSYAMARSILWDELKESIPPGWIVSINETRMSIKLRNKTLIELKGADNPDSLRGVGLHFLVIDEAQDIKEQTWTKVLRPTLASTRGDAIIIGTPKSFNWLYELYMLGKRGEIYDDGKGRIRRNHWKSWQFPTITSPFIPKEEIEAARADMDPRSFRQEFEASFETMSGRVYYAFDRAVHISNECRFNPKLPIWIGQDFNVDPMSSVIMQPQKNGELWIVDECILPSSNTQETADELARRYFKYLSTTTIFPDPAGAARSTKGRGESDIDILRDAGFTRIRAKRKHPRISDRINAVNRMFRSADGQVRMRINPNCKHSIAAFEQVIYKPGTREVDKSMSLEHPADAVGYCIDIMFPFRGFTAKGISI
jgi:Phage terminase large subunit